MNTITQKMYFRLSLIKYADKYGVSKAAIQYNVNRQYVYRWKNRYDGTIESLRDKSRRPHHHPNEHTEAELTLIKNMRRRNPDAGLVIFWVKLTQRGYTRSITGLYRVLIRLGLTPVKPPNPKYIPKEYEKMHFPGERIQIDVKYVPKACLTDNLKDESFYQYTAIDEYSRWRFVEAFDEHNSYNAAIFVKHLINAFPMRIECIQTDNGQEFTKRFTMKNPTPTMFQKVLEENGINHKLIRPFTPRHNGKVERSHRKDNERFYATHTFFSLKDLQQQLKRYNNRDYNHFPMRPLGWKTPHDVLWDFVEYGVTYV